jgi:hypothetical protein
MLYLEVKGDKEIVQALNKLADKDIRRILKTAMRGGMKPVLNTAKQNARSMVGGNMGEAIANALEVKGYRRQRKGSFAYFLGLKYDESFKHVTKTGVKHYIPAAIEYGHDNAAAIPYMRSAVESAGQAAVDKTTENIGKGIERQFKRDAKKAASSQ